MEETSRNVVAGNQADLSEKYFMMRGSDRFGPLSIQELLRHGMTPTSPVWRPGLDRWHKAAQVSELADALVMGPMPPPWNVSTDGLPPVGHATANQVAEPHPLNNVVHGGHEFIRSFRQIDLKKEIWPLNGDSVRRLGSDSTFWCVTLLAALPLLFGSFNSYSESLTAFALFFSGIWALIFCHIVQGERVGWGWRIATFFGTGIFGLLGLWIVYAIAPWLIGWVNSASVPVHVLGSVLQTGPFEEMVKAVPVLMVVFALRKKLSHADVVILGVFSGLGFAGFENLSYFNGQLQSNVLGAIQAVSAVNASGTGADVAGAQLVESAYSTMLLPLIRSLSTPFVHAICSGIFAHFIAVAALPESRGRKLALLACGLAIAAVIHGLYDGLTYVQPVLPVCVAVVGFMLFRMYLAGDTPALDAAGPIHAEPATAVA